MIYKKELADNIQNTDTIQITGLIKFTAKLYESKLNN